MDFPTLLALAMERTQLDQGQLAQLLGVDQPTISRWLQALRRPRPQAWQPIAEAIGVSYEQVAAAIGRTKLRGSKSLAEQIELLQNEVTDLREENRRLREQLQDAQSELEPVPPLDEGGRARRGRRPGAPTSRP